MSIKITSILYNNSKQYLSSFNYLTNSRDSILKLFKSHHRNFSLSNCSKMRYVQYQVNGGPQRLGAQICTGGDIFDISAVDSTIPNSLPKFLAADKSVHDRAKRIVAAASSLVYYKDVKLLSPVTHPDKVVCVGLNYSGHCDEQNKPYPKEPIIFSKFSSTISGPQDDIILPEVSTKVDYEVELAVIIGKQGKNIPENKAFEHVFGYTIAQDITARDWQKRNGGQFLLGKAMDTFCPLGPAVVTQETIDDPHNLDIKCTINGKVRQQANTKELIFKIDYLISYLSKFFTLYPGDVLLTGTPGGVGMYKNPPQYLQKGDIIESEIEGIGKMINKVV